MRGDSGPILEPEPAEYVEKRDAVVAAAVLMLLAENSPRVVEVNAHRALLDAVRALLPLTKLGARMAAEAEPVLAWQIEALKANWTPGNGEKR